MTYPFGKRAVTGAARIALVAALAAGLGACGMFKGDGPETTPTLGKREPILSRIENTATVDPSLESVPVVLPAPTANQSWAQAGGSASKSYGHLALSANPTRVWTRSIAGASQQRRLAATQTPTVAVAAHPGISNTELMRHIPGSGLPGFSALAGLVTNSPAVGALATLRAATDPEVRGGQYYGPSGFRELVGHPVLVQSNRQSHDTDVQQRLWSVSEELTGVKFPV